MSKAGIAGKLQVVPAESGKDNVLNDGFVAGNLADHAGAGRGIVQPVAGFLPFGVRQIARAGGAVPQPKLGAMGVKVADQHLQNAHGQVFTGATERSHGVSKCVYVVLALRLCLYHLVFTTLNTVFTTASANLYDFPLNALPG